MALIKRRFHNICVRSLSGLTIECGLFVFLFQSARGSYCFGYGSFVCWVGKLCICYCLVIRRTFEFWC